MEKVFNVLNDLRKSKVIENYAVGGGVAALFYTEPILTYDLDVFIFLEQKTSLLSLSSIYEYLRQKKYSASREHIVIEGVRVQFIPAYNPLIEEAVAKARTFRYGKTKVRVFRVEHLVAIMLQTNRPKDKERLALVAAGTDLNIRYLTNVLKKHDLLEPWNDFQKRSR